MKTFLLFAILLLSFTFAASAQHEFAPLVEKDLKYKDWTYKQVRDGKELNLLSAVQGKKLALNVGFANTLEVVIPDGVQIKLPDPTHVEVSGLDKQLVGQVAANIRAARKPEPYKGKGVRYSDEVVRRKAGKANATAGKK